MMGWLIALAILVLLAMLPLGVSAVYDQNGPRVRLLIGPGRLLLFPRKKKKDKPKKEKVKRKPDPGKKKKERGRKTEEKKGGSITKFLPLIRIAIDFLGDFRRKLRVRNLELKYTMAGDDPCDLAVNYGRAWAAVGNIMPQLERLFVIKKRDVEVLCDFVDNRTSIYVRLDITITLGRILSLATRYGFRALRVFLKNADNKEGGAEK